MELAGIISILFMYISFTNACPELCECDTDIRKLTCRGVTLTPEYLIKLVIPETIKEVYFINNKLSTISSTVLRPFRRVEKLVIKQNLIAEIPAFTFKDFENLTSLEINNNKLKEVNKHVFSGLNKLTNLELSYNEITDLYAGMFNSIPAIKSIKLMHNKIREIPDGVFTKLNSLSKLFMSNNEIAALGAEAFQNMSMNRIDLSSNKIKRLPRSTFKDLTIERNILLFRNNFECACRDLMSYSKYFTGLGIMGGQCASPLNLKGENIQSAYMKTDCTLCDLDLCQNGGSCQGNKTAFSCMCSDQYKGHMCERSICQPEIRYVNQVVQVAPNSNVLKYTDKQDIIAEDKNAALLEKKNNELETKLMILYAICSLELVIILCFVGLLIMGKYQDWRLMKKYNKQNSPHILEKFRNHDPDNPSGKGYISISEIIPYYT